MKKIYFISLISIILVLFPNTKNLFAQSANMGNNIVSNPNTTIYVPLNFQNMVNIGAMDIRILFDNTKLTFVDVVNLSADAAGTLANAVVINGNISRVNISWLSMGTTGVNFTNGKFLDLKFNYIGGNTPLTFDIPECEVVDWDGNIINMTYTNVNITQAVTIQSFTVSGGGSYCQGANGVSVNLSGSQTGVNYQLKKNGSSFGNLVAGTGSALVWNNLLSGNYTVMAIGGGDSLLMNGNASVNELSSLPVSASITPSQNPVTAGNSVIFTALATNGGSNPVYQWYVNNQPVGNNSNTYTYIPTNNDEIKCKVTSSELCAVNNPAFSNTVTMIVNQPLVASIDLGDTIYAENNSIIRVPVNFHNMFYIGAIDLKIDFDSTVLSFITIDSMCAEANGTLYNITNKTGNIKTVNISWLSMGTTGVDMPNGKFFDLVFLYKQGSTNLTYDLNMCEVANWDGDILNVNYTNTRVMPNTKPLNLVVYIEGLFNGINMNPVQDDMGDHFGSNIADQITVELYNAQNPSLLEVSYTNQFLYTNGNCTVTIPSSLSDAYYIVIKHRNSIATWSALPVSFSGNLINYNFTASESAAYGDNLKEVATGKFAIMVGDVNQDGLVDGSDISDTELDNNSFISGYVITDVNGDGLVDGSDMSIVEFNINNFIVVIEP